MHFLWMIQISFNQNSQNLPKSKKFFCMHNNRNIFWTSYMYLVHFEKIAEVEKKIVNPSKLYKITWFLFITSFILPTFWLAECNVFDIRSSIYGSVKYSYQTRNWFISLVWYYFFKISCSYAIQQVISQLRLNKTISQFIVVNGECIIITNANYIMKTKWIALSPWKIGVVNISQNIISRYMGFNWYKKLNRPC